METKKCFLGTNLKYLRELDGMTKSQLAKILDVSPTEIGQLERSEIPKPSFQIVEAIAEYFGVNINELARSDLRGIGSGLDRALTRAILASSSVINESIALTLVEKVALDFQYSLAQAKHYSVQRGTFSDEPMRYLQAVPKK